MHIKRLFPLFNDFFVREHFLCDTRCTKNFQQIARTCSVISADKFVCYQTHLANVFEAVFVRIFGFQVKIDFQMNRMIIAGLIFCGKSIRNTFLNIDILPQLTQWDSSRCAVRLCFNGAAG